MPASTIHIKQQTDLKAISVLLPASKSECNRALIINALGGNKSTIHNISAAQDSQTMQTLLSSKDKIWNVLDAGTTMRFLTAYAASKGLNKIMTGTQRMHERPIGILVDALREIGAKISYLKNDGFPPHEVRGFAVQKTNYIRVRSDVSSQYISALLMIAPTLPQGLTLDLTGNTGSRPYIQMTLTQMEAFGVRHSWKGKQIKVNPQAYQAIEYTVESDWSGASYWFSFVALGNVKKIKLLGLKRDSLQGDIAIVDIMNKVGVKAEFEKGGVVLTKKNHDLEIGIDFIACPDLVQTVAVACAVKGITCKMKGLESLRIKETDRIAALQNELAKINAWLIEDDSNNWILKPSLGWNKNKTLQIHTYDDHRMAMAFAPLATNCPIEIDNKLVVNKSYPTYWDHMRLAGFELVKS